MLRRLGVYCCIIYILQYCSDYSFLTSTLFFVTEEEKFFSFELSLLKSQQRLQATHLLPQSTGSFAMATQSPNANSQNLVDRLQSVLAKHKQGLIDEAITGYEEIIPLLPDSPTKVSLIGNLGSLLLSIGQYDKVYTYFDQAVTIAPDDSNAHFNLAVLLTSKLQQHGKAIKHCALAIKLDPKNYKAYHLMGNILQNLNKLDQAEKYFDLAEEIAKQEQGVSSASSSSPSAATSDPKALDSDSCANEQTECQNSLKKKAIDPVLQKLFDSLPVNPYTANIGDKTTITLHNHVDAHHSDPVECTLELQSIRPLVYTVDSIITASDCQRIKQKATELLEKSFVMGKSIDTSAYSDDNTGSNECAESNVNMIGEDPRLYRSSYNAWLPLDETLLSIQSKLSELLHFPIGYIRQKSEDLQVVKYDLGGQFKVHQDSSNFHPRLLTALIYLNDIAEQGERSDDQGRFVGGETWFPFAQSRHTDQEPPIELQSVEDASLYGLEIYEQHNQNTLALDSIGLKVVPKQGRMVIFFNYQDTGEIDPYAVHAGLPIRYFPSASSPSSSSSEIEEIGASSPEAKEMPEKWVGNYWIALDKALLNDLI